MSFQYLSISQTGKDNNIHIITLHKPPENRLNIAACQEIIRAYRTVVCTSTPTPSASALEYPLSLPSIQLTIPPRPRKPTSAATHQAP